MFCQSIDACNPCTICYDWQSRPVVYSCSSRVYVERFKKFYLCLRDTQSVTNCKCYSMCKILFTLGIRFMLARYIKWRYQKLIMFSISRKNGYKIINDLYWYILCPLWGGCLTLRRFIFFARASAFTKTSSTDLQLHLM